VIEELFLLSIFIVEQIGDEQQKIINYGVLPLSNGKQSKQSITPTATF